MITKEDFEAWQTNPVTEAVLSAVKRIGEGAKGEWLQASWNGGQLDPAILAALKAKETAYIDLSDISYEDIEEWQTPAA
jgi:uncharacterized phage-associated protein